MKTSALNNMLWLVRREFWEHRGGFLWAPVITGGIFLLLTILGLVTAEVIGARAGFSIGGSGGLQSIMAQMDTGDLSQVGMALDISMFSATALIFAVLGFVVFFYCLGALYDDRRDRSVLFWKSLPISNTSTVVSKVISATVLAPVIAVITGIVVGLLQLLMMAVVLSFHGIRVWELLLLAHPLRIAATLVAYVPLYVAWALPSVGWLLLCSAWARSKPFLWAIALPVGTGLMLNWFGILGLLNVPAGWFWQHIGLRALLSVFPGSETLARLGNLKMHLDVSGIFNLSQIYQVLYQPSLWIGVVIGVVLLTGAIWCRRWRTDI